MIKWLYTIPGLMFAVCSVAYATTTCITGDSKVFVIQKSVEPTSTSVNATNMSFELKFDYNILVGDSTSRTLTGSATCNDITTDTSGSPISQGGANTYLRAATTDSGTRCWCRLTGPVTSWWVYNRAYSNDSTCLASCTADCVDAIKNNTNKFRTDGIYMAIW